MIYEERSYRALINKDNLISYQVKIAESDLFISSDNDLTDQAFTSLIFHRNAIEKYISIHPEFRTSLFPLDEDSLSPAIIRDMLIQSKTCGVGPMASVAGAVAEFVGKDLMPLSQNVIIENGGDIFVKSQRNLKVAIYAGESPLSYKINLIIKSDETPVGICTSSATVGPSLSFGKADAVCVISKSVTLADAAASAIGNRVKNKRDIKTALEYGKNINGVQGIVVIIGREMGLIGNIELAS